MSSYCDSDGSPQIPIALANCTSHYVFPVVIVIPELSSVYPD